MNVSGDAHIACAGWTRFDVGDEIGVVLVASFGDVNRVACSIAVSFGPIAGFRVVRGLDVQMVMRSPVARQSPRRRTR